MALFLSSIFQYELQKKSLICSYSGNQIIGLFDIVSIHKYIFENHYLGRAIQKRVIGQMLTAEA